MFGLITGFALGYIAFTDGGHKVGNWIADNTVTIAKKMLTKKEADEHAGD